MLRAKLVKLHTLDLFAPHPLSVPSPALPSTMVGSDNESDPIDWDELLKLKEDGSSREARRPRWPGDPSRSMSLQIRRRARHFPFPLAPAPPGKRWVLVPAPSQRMRMPE